MDITNFIMLFGGLSFFLYGMKVLSTGLEKASGNRLRSALSKITGSLPKSLLLGAGITIAIQSSSALTVMLVGLVNSGLMTLSQSIGVIMGSNVGTTLTAWITSLSGLKSDNVWINLLKPENFSLVFSFLGVVLITVSKSGRKKDIGSIFVGFAVLMYGMKLMSSAMAPLGSLPQFVSILTAFNSPIIGVVTGAIFTAVIQSSAASVAILQSLALTGGLTYGMAIPIILGQNIGTCVTALLSAIGVSSNAKKVSVIHVAFNVIGSTLCLAVFYLIKGFYADSFITDAIDTSGIAVVHSVFNILTTLVLLPFARYLEKIADFVVRDKGTVGDKGMLLDDRLLTVPAVAMSKCSQAAVKMAHMSKKNLRRAISLMNRYDEELAQKLVADEEKIDSYEDKLSSYLVKLSATDLNEGESMEVSKLLYTIGDFERISDHSINLMNIASNMAEKNIQMPTSTANELTVITKAVYKISVMTVDCFEKNSTALAHRVEPLEQVIDGLIESVRIKNTKRIQTKSSPVELSFVLSDILNDYERISDHCSNIAVAVIETQNRAFGAHSYLSKYKRLDNPQFSRIYNEYHDMFSLD